MVLLYSAVQCKIASLQCKPKVELTLKFRRRKNVENRKNILTSIQRRIDVMSTVQGCLVVQNKTSHKWDNIKNLFENINKPFIFNTMHPRLHKNDSSFII